MGTPSFDSVASPPLRCKVALDRPDNRPRKGPTMRLCVLLTAGALVAHASAGENWPRFRGPDGNGVVAGAVHPDTWSADEHIAWKTKIPGIGWSQPIVWGDKAFVTTAVSEKGQRPKPGDWSPGDAGVMTLVFG